MKPHKAKERFDNFGKTFTLDEARKDVHILIDDIYKDIDINFEKLFDVIKYTENKELIITLIKQTHNNLTNDLL